MLTWGPSSGFKPLSDDLSVEKPSKSALKCVICTVCMLATSRVKKYSRPSARPRASTKQKAWNHRLVLIRTRMERRTRAPGLVTFAMARDVWSGKMEQAMSAIGTSAMQVAKALSLTVSAISMLVASKCPWHTVKVLTRIPWAPYTKVTGVLTCSMATVLKSGSTRRVYSRANSKMDYGMVTAFGCTWTNVMKVIGATIWWKGKERWSGAT